MSVTSSTSTATNIAPINQKLKKDDISSSIFNKKVKHIVAGKNVKPRAAICRRLDKFFMW